MPKRLKKKSNKGKPVGRLFLGIDPGKSGGYAIVSQGGLLLEHKVAPTTTLDLWNWISRKEGLNKAYLEKVWAAPVGGAKQGGSAMFTFGNGYGHIQMALTAMGLPYDNPTPRDWQKAMKIPGKKKTESKPQFKERLRKRAQQLFPRDSVWERTLGEQRAVCDAILIAEYGRRIENGEI